MQEHIKANDQLRAETIAANTTLRGNGTITGATTVNGTVSRNKGESSWLTRGWPIPQRLFNSPVKDNQGVYSLMMEKQ
jgi:hypothetical protein